MFWEKGVVDPQVGLIYEVKWPHMRVSCWVEEAEEARLAFGVTRDG